MRLAEFKNGVMGYRDMTAEEETEHMRQQSEIPVEQPTQTDRIEAQVMYSAMMTGTLLDMEV